VFLAVFLGLFSGYSGFPGRCGGAAKCI